MQTVSEEGMTTQHDALRKAQEELEESSCLLCALLHEERTDDEITEQILDNRTAINAIKEALSQQAEQEPQPQPVAWFTEDHLTDKSATTWNPEVAERWRAKGWPVGGLWQQAPSTAAQSKCLPHGLRYMMPPLELTGHQVMHLAEMARVADSLGAVWLIKELEPKSAIHDGESCPGGIAAITDGQPGWALLAHKGAQGEKA